MRGQSRFLVKSDLDVPRQIQSEESWFGVEDPDLSGAP